MQKFKNGYLLATILICSLALIVGIAGAVDSEVATSGDDTTVNSESEKECRARFSSCSCATKCVEVEAGEILADCARECTESDTDNYTPECGYKDGICGDLKQGNIDKSIELEGEGAKIKWNSTTHPKDGFKVVWSKNEGPTYPARKGDNYHYYSDPDKSRDDLTAFDGSGTYFVRVCEYLGGQCGVYSNEIKVELFESPTVACDDVDGGKNKNVYGKIYYGEEMYEDYCYGNALIEYYCYEDSGKTFMDTVTLQCEKGCYKGECSGEKVGVEAIKLYNDGEVIKWRTEGFAAKGFKVVWSKNESPTYPTREGDRYRYFSGSKRNHFEDITAFDGDGTYYVRVCEYLGGQCGVYSNEIRIQLGGYVDPGPVYCTEEYAPVCGVDGVTYGNKCAAKYQDEVDIAYHGVCRDKRDRHEWFRKAKWQCADGSSKHKENNACKTQEKWKMIAIDNCADGEVAEFAVLDECRPEDDNIVRMKNKAKDMFEDKFGAILDELRMLRDIVKEQQIQIKYLTTLKEDVQALSSKVEETINNFITYGVDDNTKNLGAGERAAVMHSFKKAFNKLPESEDEMTDAIKIANGRWPTLRSEEAEKEAREHFEKIYKKIPNMDDQNDNAAITVMAYGLRQKAENRSLDSERQGIETFQNIFGYHPNSTEDWNIMQAITYSGSARGADTDGDLLLDEREAELGTDPNNPDTDGDGFLDGDEVANGFDPLNK